MNELVIEDIGIIVVDEEEVGDDQVEKVRRRLPVSQYNTETAGIAVYEGNDLTDADGDINVTIAYSDSDIEADSGVATKDEVGLYSYLLTPTVTAKQGKYTVTWSYTVNANARIVRHYISVVAPMPVWDSMTTEERQLVENVYHHIADSFDSSEGGPYLQELPQSLFGYETIARLMATTAIDYINFSKPKAFVPPYEIGADSAKQFPPQWFGLLAKATLYATLRHLARNYTEIPDTPNVNVARLDRSAYRQRWNEEAALEKIELDSFLVSFKRTYLYSSARGRALLLGGGIYPRGLILNAARPHFPYYAARFF